MGYEFFRYARRIDADTLEICHDDMTRLLALNKAVANTIILEGGGVAGDKLKIKAPNDWPYISVEGGGDIIFDMAPSRKVVFKEQNVAFLGLYEDGTDDIIEGETVNNDLFLKPNGTGVVKFGTKTGTGDVAVDGYVSIKDAAGTTVKLATVA